MVIIFTCFGQFLQLMSSAECRTYRRDYNYPHRRINSGCVNGVFYYHEHCLRQSISASGSFKLNVKCHRRPAMNSISQSITGPQSSHSPLEGHFVASYPTNLFSKFDTIPPYAAKKHNNTIGFKAHVLNVSMSPKCIYCSRAL